MKVDERLYRANIKFAKMLLQINSADNFFHLQLFTNEI